MDKLAKKSKIGYTFPISPGIPVGSDVGHILLFGYEPSFYKGRGLFEALGLGIKKYNGIAFRANLATYKIDRRAGRIPFGMKELFEELHYEKDGMSIHFKHSFEHRGVMFLEGVSPEEVKCPFGNDNHGKPWEDFKKRTSKRVREFLESFLKYAHKKLNSHPINQERKKRGYLPANYVLFRGGSPFLKAPQTFQKKHNLKATFIAGGNLYKGVARFFSMNVPNVEGATGDSKTNLGAKFDTAISSKTPLTFVHIKATDSLAHDKKPQEKIKFLQKIDSHLKHIEEHFDHIIITGDHATSSIKGRHTGGPVPLLVYGYGYGDGMKFSEKNCKKGTFANLRSIHLMDIVKDLHDLSPLIGE